MIRQAHTDLLGAMGGATLIAVAIVVFAVLVSAQVFRDWPIAALGGSGDDSAAVSKGREVSARASGATAAAAAAGAKSATASAGGKGARQAASGSDLGGGSPAA